MSLSDLDALLKGVCPDTYREAAPEGLSRYVVWGQDDTTALYGDDSAALILPRVWIDVYTQSHDDELPLDVIDALNAAGQPVGITGPEYLDKQLSLVVTLTLTLV